MFSISLLPMIKKYLLVFIFFTFSGLVAKANFVYDATCIDAYKAILSLRMNEAQQLIAKKKQQNPTNNNKKKQKKKNKKNKKQTTKNKNNNKKQKNKKDERIS